MSNTCDSHEEQANRLLIVASVDYHTLKGKTLRT